MSQVQIQKLKTFKGHRDCVYTLEAVGDPGIFFSASGDGMIVQWDLRHADDGHLLAKLPASVYALHYHLPSDILIAGQNYNGVHLFDWKNKKEIGSLKITETAIFDIKGLGDFVYAGCGSGEVVQIDLKNLKVMSRVSSSGNSARTIAIDPDSGEIAVGYSDHHVRIFDQNLQPITGWKAHDNSVFTVQFTPDGQHLMTGSRDARLKLWDRRDGYKKRAEVVAHMYAINHIQFSPDGKHFVTCSMDKTIKVWDYDTLQLLKVIDRSRHAGHATSVNKLLWTSYQDQLLSASDDRTISNWHIIF